MKSKCIILEYFPKSNYFRIKSNVECKEKMHEILMGHLCWNIYGFSGRERKNMKSKCIISEYLSKSNLFHIISNVELREKKNEMIQSHSYMNNYGCSGGK